MAQKPIREILQGPFADGLATTTGGRGVPSAITDGGEVLSLKTLVAALLAGSALLAAAARIATDVRRGETLAREYHGWNRFRASERPPSAGTQEQINGSK